MGLKENSVGSIPDTPECFRGRAFRRSFVSRNTLERGTREGNSPVDENDFVLLAIYLEYHGK